MLKIDIIAPALPPQIDGLGDYSSLIAPALARTCEVRILTVVGHEHLPVPNSEVVPVFDPIVPTSVWKMLPYIEERKPDWILLQYNPFAYGLRGFNPYLPSLLEKAKKRVPGLRVAMMAHETFLPFISLKFAIMNIWQYPQFYRLGKACEALYVSVEPWTERFKKWFPGIPVTHLPVGSNIPLLSLSRAEAKQRLGIDPKTLVLGLFGQGHPSRQFDWVAAAYYYVLSRIPGTTLLYIGPAKPIVEAALAGEGKGGNLLLDGPFPHDEISRRLLAMDIMIAPYVDGLSTRRGVLMAAIQHGIPTVGTSGISTDSVLVDGNNKAFVMAPAPGKDAFLEAVLQLAEDEALRERMGPEAQRFYDAHFSWEILADRTLEVLNAVPPRK